MSPFSNELCNQRERMFRPTGLQRSSGGAGRPDYPLALTGWDRSPRHHSCSRTQTGPHRQAAFRKPPRTPSSGRSITAATPTTSPRKAPNKRAAASKVPRWDQIVDDDNPVAGTAGVGMHFDRRRAILQRVIFGDGLVRQLALLSHQHDGLAELEGQRAAQKESRASPPPRFPAAAANGSARRRSWPGTLPHPERAE